MAFSRKLRQLDFSAQMVLQLEGFCVAAYGDHRFLLRLHGNRSTSVVPADDAGNACSPPNDEADAPPTQRRLMYDLSITEGSDALSRAPPIGWVRPQPTSADTHRIPEKVEAFRGSLAFPRWHENCTLKRATGQKGRKRMPAAATISSEQHTQRRPHGRRTKLTSGYFTRARSEIVVHSLPVKRVAQPKLAPAPAAKKENHWLEIQLNGRDGQPAAFVKCEIVFADGEKQTHRTNQFGVIRIDGYSSCPRYRVRLVG